MLQPAGDFPELFEFSFHVFDDFLSEDIGIGLELLFFEAAILSWIQIEVSRLTLLHWLDSAESAGASG